MNLLASFIEYHKRQAEGKIKDLYLLAFKNGQQQEPASSSYLPPARGPRQARRFELPTVAADGEIKISDTKVHTEDGSFVEKTSNVIQGSNTGPALIIRRA